MNKASKVKCTYCKKLIPIQSYRSHSGPCYEANYLSGGRRKNQKERSAGSSHHGAAPRRRHSRDTARPFAEDGSANWGYAARSQGRYGSHATFDDYSEDSWS